MNLTERLDKIATEIEKEDPVIAMAIDKISDRLETAGMLDGIKNVIKKIMPAIAQHIRPVPKDEAVASLISLMKKYPNASKLIGDFMNTLSPALDPMMGKKGASMNPEAMGEALSALISLSDKKMTEKDIPAENRDLAKNIMSLLDNVQQKAKALSLTFKA